MLRVLCARRSTSSSEISDDLAINLVRRATRRILGSELLIGEAGLEATFSTFDSISACAFVGTGTESESMS